MSLFHRLIYGHWPRLLAVDYDFQTFEAGAPTFHSGTVGPKGFICNLPHSCGLNGKREAATAPLYEHCGAILNCARIIHIDDDRHEREDGVSWHWHETALPHRSAAPAPLDGLREALAEAVWATSDTAEDGPWIDAPEAQRRMTLEWADAIIERVPTLRDKGETP